MQALLRSLGAFAPLGFLLAAAASDTQTFWAPVNTPRAKYEITARVGADKRVRGSEIIRFQNTGAAPLYELTLDQKPTQAIVNGTPARLAGERPTVIELPSPIAPGQTVELRVAFDGALELFYPRLLWGSRSHDDYVVRLQVPDGYQVAATARLDPQTQSWRAEGVRLFGADISKDLLVDRTTASGVEISVFHTKAGEPCARYLLESAADVVTFYKQHFGMYPHASLVIMPGGDRPVGGYPMGPGMVVIHGQERFNDKPKEFWRWITAHEIGHQYWSEYVMAEGDDTLSWPMIGLGIYCDREYSLARGTTTRHKEWMREYTDAVRAWIDTTIDRTDEQIEAVNFDFNNKVLHAKSWSIMSALESVIGRETFSRMHQRALREYGGRRFHWRDLQKLAEQESGQDLEWFFQQWVRSSKWLAYDVTDRNSSREGNRYVSSVQVKQRGTLQMPVPVEAVFEDGTRQRRWTSRLLSEQTLVFTSAAPLKAAMVDPDNSLPQVIPLPGPPPNELSKKMDALDWSGNANEARQLFPEAKNARLPAMAWLKLGLNLFDGAAYPEALEAFHRMALNAADARELTPALVWQGHILDLLGRREEAIAAYKAALEKIPQGFNMRHDQWKIKIDKQWLDERLLRPFPGKP